MDYMQNLRAQKKTTVNDTAKALRPFTLGVLGETGRDQSASAEEQQWRILPRNRGESSSSTVALAGWYLPMPCSPSSKLHRTLSNFFELSQLLLSSYTFVRGILWLRREWTPKLLKRLISMTPQMTFTSITSATALSRFSFV